MAVTVVAVLGFPSAYAQAPPAPPQTFLDTSYPVMTGTTIAVSAGGDFQSALNVAQPGDTITLQAGATYTGNFTLPVKSGTGWIVIRTSAPDSSLPPAGQRISPAYASVLPKIVTPNTSAALKTAAAAHHYRLTGVEITMASNVTLNYGLVLLGDGSTAQDTLSELPYNLVLDRVYVHGQPTANLSRAVGLNASSAAVIDSYLSEAHLVGADSQAICGWNGPGPFKIVNNYLEGAGENVMFGGADPAIANLVPSDIEIRGNHFYKPLRWKIGHPTYAGIAWTIKNLFELKNARRVLVTGNVFEHNWWHAQNGFAILFTVRNQSGTAPWSVVEDVTFTQNIVRHVSSGVNFLGTDNIHPSQQTKRILIKDNLFEDVNPVTFGGMGRLFQVLSGTADVAIDHNTAFHTEFVILAEGAPHARFGYKNNLTSQYKVTGGGTALGIPTLNTYFPGAVFLKNVLVGGNPAIYPPENFFPASLTDVLFVDLPGGNYRLQTTSPYKNAGTDGKDIGADIDAVMAATAGAVSGNGGGPPADTLPPVVAITSPYSGATVAGTITIAASATDTGGVAGVRFHLDGTALGDEDVTAPYSTTWNTTNVGNGLHTVTAVARDTAGNSATSAPVVVTVANAPPQQLPYLGSPFQIPGEFQAEDFDTGGEGIAYHDIVPGNAGGHYRLSEDVDIINPPNGYVVNNFQTGEWLEYTINVAQSGTYRFELLVSCGYYDSRFRMEIDGTDRTGSVFAPYTGSWWTFQYVGKSGISLSAGQHVLRVFAEQEYFNVDAIRINLESATQVQFPYGGSPFQIPGEFQGEDFDTGGEGIAYHDMVPGNAGGHYRLSEDVDIINPYPNGYVVNNFQTGEWLEYTINVVQSGTYRLEALLSCGYNNTRFHMEIDGTDRTGSVLAPNTGSWWTFQYVGIGGISLSAGQHVLRIFAEQEYFNLDAIRISADAAPLDTTPPTVGMTAPTGGATVANTVVISANASDNVGIVGVQFHLDGAALDAEDSSAPFSVSWDTTAAGNGLHTLTAVARDAAGNISTSAPVTVTVSNTTIPTPADTIPPTVAITTPASGMAVANFVTISAYASDNVGVAGVRFYLDGVALGEEDTTVPYSNFWDTTKTSGGSHTLTAVARDAAGNSSSAAVFVTVANNNNNSQSPYKGSAHQLPGRFEAEDFDRGGEAVAYHDLTPGNQGNHYRLADDIDIINPYPDGYVVNNFQTGEWIEYTINVSESGTYQLDALVSSGFDTSRFHIEVDGIDQTGMIAVPNTGSWRNFVWVGKGGITLSAGQHILRIHADLEYFNLDAIRVNPSVTAPGRTRGVRS